MEPRLRATYDQFLAITEFMERHGDISRTQTGLLGRIRSEQLWQDLTTILNAIGGGVTKPSEKWKKVWADWKSKTKKKALSIKKHTNRTGGGIIDKISLTTLEERVVAILGLTAVKCQSSIEEKELSTPNNCVSEDEILSVKLQEDELELKGPMSPLLQDPRQQLRPPAVPLLTSPPLTIQPRAVTLSSQSMISSSPRRFLRRRRLAQTLFDRAEFVEQRRLQFEELRERNFHEREVERLRLESRRVEAEREQQRNFHEREVERLRLESRKVEAEIEWSRVLNRLGDIAQMFLERM